MSAEVLRVTSWCGLVTGLLEGAEFLVFQKLGRVRTSRLKLSGSRHSSIGSCSVPWVDPDGCSLPIPEVTDQASSAMGGLPFWHFYPGWQ